MECEGKKKRSPVFLWLQGASSLQVEQIDMIADMSLLFLMSYEAAPEVWERYRTELRPKLKLDQPRRPRDGRVIDMTISPMLKALARAGLGGSTCARTSVRARLGPGLGGFDGCSAAAQAPTLPDT
jgi:hypothetical protein